MILDAPSDRRGVRDSKSALEQIGLDIHITRPSTGEDVTYDLFSIGNSSLSGSHSSDVREWSLAVVFAVALVGVLVLLTGIVTSVTLCYLCCTKSHRMRGVNSFLLTPLMDKTVCCEKTFHVCVWLSFTNWSDALWVPIAHAVLGIVIGNSYLGSVDCAL